MKYLFKNFSFVLLLGLLFSCEGLSQLLTTNVFEIIENKDKPSVPLEEVSDWKYLDSDALKAKIEKYSAMALTNTDSEALFFTLRENPDAMENVRYYFNKYLDDPGVPNLDNFDTSDEYLESLNSYQRTAAALAKIEVYSTDAEFVDGFDDMILNYANGTNTGDLDSKTIYKDIFGVSTTSLQATEEYEERARVEFELEAAINAGVAYNQLGDSIFNKDFPESVYISDADATLIFLSCVTSRIVVATKEAHPNLSEEEIISQFVDGIFSDNSDNFGDSDIIFPEDQPNGDLNTIERYLGEGGAVVFTATNYSLDILFGGDQ